jgi:AcrR family transcriptional regulator
MTETQDKIDDEEGAGGVRDKWKAESVGRIKSAARDLFIQSGYEKTTFRTVALRANVSAATIVNYFGDKTDLLATIFNEDHKKITQKALSVASEEKDFLQQSIDGFRSYYEFFGNYPKYARAIMRLGAFYEPALNDTSTMGESAARSVKRIKQTVEIARRRGEITIDETDETLSLLIMGIYLTECRYWLASALPEVEIGLDHLRRTLSILLRGMADGSHNQ